MPALFCLALIVAPAFGAALAVPVAIALSFLPSGQSGVAYVGLNKEIWLPEILEGFYPDWSFVTEMRDLSAFVDNDVINLTEAGVNPAVFVNNTSYPIAFAQRSDVPLTLSLDTYDTENTLIRSIETAELSYDKRSSVIFGHKQSLQMTFMKKAAFVCGPTTHGTFTPLLAATGADNGSGLKALKYSDVQKLKRAFNNANIPMDGRILVLTTQHQSDLELEDAARYNQVMTQKTLAGFKIYEVSDDNCPRYHKGTGVKYVYGAADDGNQSYASFAFHKMEVGRAQGSQDMFLTEKDPTHRGDILGFQMRALTTTLRAKGIGAIYSPTA